MARQGLDPKTVLKTAVDLVNRDGTDALTLVRLAQALKVKPPSLYNHISGLDDLKRLMAIQGLKALAANLQAAAVGKSRERAALAIAHAYRAFARGNPGLYPLTIPAPPARDEAWQRAGRSVYEVVQAALSEFEFTPTQEVHAIRCLRSALHGFVALEISGGLKLPTNLEDSFEILISSIYEGLRKAQRHRRH